MKYRNETGGLLCIHEAVKNDQLPGGIAPMRKKVEKGEEFEAPAKKDGCPKNPTLAIQWELGNLPKVED